MLTFRQIQNCEGYYYNRETGQILRNVSNGNSTCWSGGAAEETFVTEDRDAPQFELLTTDVSLPLDSVVRLAEEKYGPLPPAGFLNRQTATQIDGNVVTQEAKIYP